MTNYHWNAKDYAQHSQGQQVWARELISKSQLKGTQSVLDLGCGDGKVTAELAAGLPAGKVTGVDYSPDMIATATETFPPSQYPNLSFAVMDATQIRFAGTFDLVFSNAALHWVKDHKAVNAGLYACLKPGGRILLQMGGHGNAAGILQTLQALQAEPAWSDYFTDFAFPYTFPSVEDYRILLADAGFKAKRIELLPKTMEHADAAALAGWIRTAWLPYTSRIPENQRDRFIQAVVRHYLTQTPLDTNGKAYVDMVRLEIEAEKPLLQHA